MSRKAAPYELHIEFWTYTFKKSSQLKECDQPRQRESNAIGRVRLSVCFYSIVWTKELLTLILCVCMGRERSSNWIESRGPMSNSKVRAKMWCATRLFIVASMAVVVGFHRHIISCKLARHRLFRISMWYQFLPVFGETIGSTSLCVALCVRPWLSVVSVRAFQFAIRIDSIRYANRFESIRFVKKSAFRFTNCHTVSCLFIV